MFHFERREVQTKYWRIYC